MTVRRPAARTAPRSEPGRTFDSSSDFGVCEHEDCDRRARESCPTCSGEHCLAHAPHAVHGAARST